MTQLQIDEIKANKIAAYNHVGEIAEQLLTVGSANPFSEILTAWEEYELWVREEEAYLKKYMPECYNPIQAVMTYRNIKDIYWYLPKAAKANWDKFPELKSWKDQYR